MATLSWSQVVAIAASAAKQELLELLDDVGFTATSWQPFSIPATMLEETALVWSRLADIAVYLKSAFLVQTAEGEALTRLSDSHYDNQRADAQTAQRAIVLACSAAEGPHEIDLGDLVVSDAMGNTFRNVDDGTTVYPVSLTSGGSLTLRFEAEVAGSAANVANGTVGALVTTLAGVTITSDVSFRLGVDEESDARLRVRDSSKWTLLTAFEIIDDAVEAIVLNAVPGVAIVRVDSTNPRGAGTFDVYVAGADATSPSEDVTAASNALTPYVFSNTGTAEPTFKVLAAPETTLTLAGIVYYSNTFDQTDVISAVEVALETFLLSIPLGGFDYSPGPSNVVPKNDIETVIKATNINGQSGIKTVVLNIPTLDIAVGSFAKVVKPATWGLAYVAVNA